MAIIFMSYTARFIAEEIKALYLRTLYFPVTIKLIIHLAA